MFSTLRVLRSKTLLTTEIVSKGRTSSIHICSKVNISRSGNSILWRQRGCLPLFSFTQSNFASTGTSKAEQDVERVADNLAETIPEPPTAPHITETIDSQTSMDSAIPALTEVLQNTETTGTTTDIAQFLSGGEPTFESLGLGGWTPVGMVQQCMEFLHITADLPWWGSIVVGTIIVRTLMFPLVIIAQRNAARMNNHMPQMQTIQLKMSDARERGDRMDAAKYGQELMRFMKDKGLNPLKNMLVPLAQAPLFISFFMSLRQMSSLPVESLKNGGLFWFADLTLPDQFYLLPIITSLTLSVTIEIGTDAARLNAANMGMMKYVIRVLPFAIFPFTLGFPAAILVYWTSSNFISLIQVSFLKIPRIREFFKIDSLLKHDTKKLPIKDKGFVTGVKDSWTNMKITRELEDRQRVDEMNFRRAGRGAVKKTYKYDPTQMRPPRNIGAIEAKKRE